jgi:integrase
MARRRGRQKGHLKIEGNAWRGYWWEEIKDPATGKLKWHKFSKTICDANQLDPRTRRLRAVTQTEAQKLFDELVLNKLAIVNTNPQSLAKLAEYVEKKFLPSKSLKSRKTREHYRNILNNHILPALGDFRLRDIRLDDVQELIFSELAAGKSSQTVIHVRNILSTVFRRAKAHGWFAGDIPTEGLEMPKLTHRSRTALTADQIRTLLGGCDRLMYAVVLTDSLLGLRRGELAGLRWQDLNLTDQPVMLNGEVIPPYAVAIREQFVWVWGRHLAKDDRGGKYQALKTDNGKRNIPLTDAVLQALEELGASRARFLEPQDPVFVGRNGKPLNMPNYLQRHFQPLLERLGLPAISWHDLRHTSATLAEIAGATVTSRRKIHGHGSDRMAQHYSHADMDEARSSLQRMEEAVLPKPRLRRVK